MSAAAIAVAILAAVPFSAFDAKAKDVTSGTRIKSPNGMFEAKCETGEQLHPAVGRIEIVDTKNGTLQHALEINPPLYALRWTGDSRTLIAIERVAGGSVAVIVHRSSGKWSVFQADPQHADKSAVIALRPKMRAVELSYKTYQQEAHGKEGRFYVITFLVDPNTGHHRHETKHEIDLETYRRLRLESAAKG